MRRLFSGWEKSTNGSLAKGGSDVEEGTEWVRFTVAITLSILAREEDSRRSGSLK
jgi:hypothetical protein